MEDLYKEQRYGGKEGSSDEEMDESDPSNDSEEDIPEKKSNGEINPYLENPKIEKKEDFETYTFDSEPEISQYNLILNIHEEDYYRNRATISTILCDLNKKHSDEQSKPILQAFKSCLHDRKSVKSNDIYKNHLYWHALKNNNTHKAIAIAKTMSDKDPQKKERYINYYPKKNLSIDEINSKIEDVRYFVNSFFYHIGQGQCLLFPGRIVEENPEKLLRFTQELDQELRKIGIRPGNCNDADPPITPFISFQHNNKSYQYYAQNKKTRYIGDKESRAALKRSQEQCKIYKYLSSNIRYPGKPLPDKKRTQTKVASHPQKRSSSTSNNHSDFFSSKTKDKAIRTLKMIGQKGSLINSLLLAFGGLAFGGMELAHSFHKYETVDQFNKAMSENLDVVKTVFASYGGAVVFLLALWAITSLVEKNCAKTADSEGEGDSLLAGAQQQSSSS